MESILNNLVESPGQLWEKGQEGTAIVVASYLRQLGSQMENLGEAAEIYHAVACRSTVSIYADSDCSMVAPGVARLNSGCRT